MALFIDSNCNKVSLPPSRHPWWAAWGRHSPCHQDPSSSQCGWYTFQRQPSSERWWNVSSQPPCCTPLPFRVETRTIRCVTISSGTDGSGLQLNPHSLVKAGTCQEFGLTSGDKAQHVGSAAITGQHTSWRARHTSSSSKAINDLFFQFLGTFGRKVRHKV